MNSLHVVLVEPCIPQNTGNVARTCASTGTVLHLVEPLGFSVSDRYLKRAGLDYWHMVDIFYHQQLDEVFDRYPEGSFYFATTKAKNVYSDVTYPDNSFIVFGKETAGLPEALLKSRKESCIRIPMAVGARSLNLANSVAVVVYEVLRQKGFPGLRQKGRM